MTIDGNNNMFKEKRIKERRKEQNRRASVRFGDAFGRREGKERRVSMYMSPG